MSDATRPPENDLPRYPQLLVDVAPEDADEAAAFLCELGADGVEERDGGTLATAAVPGKTTLVASFGALTSAEAAAAHIDQAWTPRVAELVGDAWRDEWKKYFVPFRLTNRVTIRPPWEPYTPSDPAELVLELEPGRAFGTGLHPTTALVARAIEAHSAELFQPKGRRGSVLDVGTGSGILALVALVLGAAMARAIDVDADAVALARENADRNGLGDRLQVDAAPVEAIDGAFDLVLANIEASVLITLAEPLARRVAKPGILILSGILQERAAEVRRAFASFDLAASPAQGEWSALVLRAR
ncbi:MAG TPA: 50S ribosomal protein L11 methyltransferase [Polyangiaceae bacterium]|jgi:ribosomal protein L11 methyltransferase|nr:50S ribosomal protein L11 methyltransferase [Polyangiaceae bacterium]